jgi:hypothetical protein
MRARGKFSPREAGEVTAALVTARLVRVWLGAALLVAVYLGATQGKAAAIAAALVTGGLWLVRPRPPAELIRRAQEVAESKESES